jgi:hypothetical protein
MRSLLLVLAFTYILLVPIPAWAQTSQGGASGDQYGTASGDQYAPYGPFPVGPGAAQAAVHAALMASGALQTPSGAAQANGEGSASAAEPSKIVPSERDAAFAEQGDAVASAEAQGENASAAEAQDESANTSDLEKLPQTGGPSPLWLLGAPLICIGGIIARRILLA